MPVSLVTSVGGKKSVQELAIAIAHQVDKDQTKPVPVVRLKKDHYQHKSYGRIFTPVFEVTGWMSLGEPGRRAGRRHRSPSPPRVIQHQPEGERGRKAPFFL
jgi:hypothetical protein